MKYVYGITYRFESYTPVLEKTKVKKETEKTVTLENWSYAYGKKTINKRENIAFSKSEAVDNEIKELRYKLDKLQNEMSKIESNIQKLQSIKEES